MAGTSASTSTLSPKLVQQAGKTAIGFTVPTLPRGVYDAWYVDGRPSTSKAASPTIAPPDPKASQSVVFEIKPQLRALKSVVLGRPGTDVDIAIATTSGPAVPPGDSISIALSGFNVVASLAASQKATSRTGADGIAHFKVRVASEGDVYLAATAPGYAGIAIRVVGGIEYHVREAKLQPGDLLLCQGKGTISDAIQLGERVELGSPNPKGRPWYSHVAVFLGKGDIETAEMLDEGLVKHTLEDTITNKNGCTTLDVYRKTGITSATQKQVAKVIQSYADVPADIPYAWGQIATMGAAGLLRLSIKVETSFWGWTACVLTSGVTCGLEAAWDATLEKGLILAASEAALFDAGKQKMICSEMAAWAYHDAGADLNVAPWWPTLVHQGFVGSQNSQMDYTTPNMIPRSKDVEFVFQLWPPEAPGVTVVGGQIQISEKIDFDTGSAVIRKDGEDVLQEMVTILQQQIEIKHVRVEGHTDNVGSSAVNKALSQQRADAVVRWLVNHGIDAARLHAVGVGDASPIVPNDSEENRHLNRRVEFHIEQTKGN